LIKQWLDLVEGRKKELPEQFVASFVEVCVSLSRLSLAYVLFSFYICPSVCLSLSVYVCVQQFIYGFCSEYELHADRVPVVRLLVQRTLFKGQSERVREREKETATERERHAHTPTQFYFLPLIFFVLFRLNTTPCRFLEGVRIVRREKCC